VQSPCAAYDTRRSIVSLPLVEHCCRDARDSESTIEIDPVSSALVRRRNERQGAPGSGSFRLMWGLLGLAILIPVVLSIGGLEAARWWLFAGLILALLGFLVAGTVWERRSGVSRFWSRPWMIREKLAVYVVALMAGSAVGILYVISKQH
jgi:hypothetical protein